MSLLTLPERDVLTPNPPILIEQIESTLEEVLDDAGLYWMDQYGELWPINGLEPSHHENLIAFLKRKVEQEPEWTRYGYDECAQPIVNWTAAQWLEVIV